MTQKFVDLHTHTKASDGTDSPADNVRAAKAAGLAAVAITDHDTVAGLPEAEEEGRNLGIIVVPGVEISTVAKDQDIHILGYYFNREDPVFLERLEHLRKVRDTRNDLMIARLQELGLEITMEEVLKNRKPGTQADETVGRPHIAEVLIRKGYVSSLEEAFDKYIGRDGAAYVNPPRITPEEGIRLIHDAGGKAVLAHPALYRDDALVEQLAQNGLDGLEAFHSDHRLEDSDRYLALAERYGLIVTAGSDYHGQRNGKVFHAPLGSRKIDISVLEQLQKEK